MRIGTFRLVERVAVISIPEARDAFSFEPGTIIGYWFGDDGPDRPPVVLRLKQAPIKSRTVPQDIVELGLAEDI